MRSYEILLHNALPIGKEARVRPFEDIGIQPLFYATDTSIVADEMFFRWILLLWFSHNTQNTNLAGKRDTKRNLPEGHFLHA